MTVVYTATRVTLHHGDCRAILAAMEPASVDAIVTDPPYDLTGASRNGSPRQNDPATPFGRTKLGGDRGFMGKTWDGTGVAFDPATWMAALRVLRPGGHLLAFGGTRTHHRLMCAIEDAGFEIRDCLMWLYGCLTEDAEILTEYGWKRGVDVGVGERVAQWDAGRISLAPVLDKMLAPYSGPMVRLVNHDTDQMLTPNHRIYHWAHERVQVNGVRRAEWSGLRVSEASTIDGYTPLRLPLAGLHDGRGIGGEEYAALLGWVWTEGGFDHAPSTGVRLYQSSVNADKVGEIAGLLDCLVPAHKRYDRARTYKSRAYTETTWFFTGDMAQRVRADLPDKHPTYALLWRMTLAEKRAFWRAAMAGDGSGVGAAFYQKSEADLEWAQTLLATMGQRGRVTMRKNRPGGGLFFRRDDKTEVQARHLKHRHEQYTGTVWCVSVQSGAFVARRQGLVFVTGNSGFPKSLDVSKAIDKAAGQLGIQSQGANYAGGEYPPRDKRFRSDYGYQYAPLTDDSRQWSGWGTALKPAWEIIILARKPLSEPNVAANVLRHGTGALNVDACRIAGDQRPLRVTENHHLARSAYEGGAATSGGSRAIGATDLGRWPANLVLDGAAAALLDAASEPRMHSAGSASPGNPEWTRPYAASSYTIPGQGFRLGDSGGASRFFYTSKAGAEDRDGSKHPTVKPLDLMKWLVRLVTPPGGICLDPFMGSGSTIVAARELGFVAIGIDQDATYCADAQRRLRQDVLF